MKSLKQDNLVYWPRNPCLYICFFAGAVVILSIPLYEMSGRFCLSLPNHANMAFYFPWLLYVYPPILLMGKWSVSSGQVITSDLLIGIGKSLLWDGQSINPTWWVSLQWVSQYFGMDSSSIMMRKRLNLMGGWSVSNG